MDKPVGPTSHDVVTRVRRALRMKAVGHTGTLDPFASGLLVILLGRATRLAQFVERHDKTYLATAKLGVRTTTDDLTGEVLSPPPLHEAERGVGGEVPSRTAVEAALHDFLGPQKQRPPAFSARKIGGERSYRLARRGVALELAESDVMVHELELVEFRYPDLVFRTRVSAGTYVRALARDIGETLGTGAHLTALRREAIGTLRVELALSLDVLNTETPILAPLSVVGHLPRVELSEAQVTDVGHGRAAEIGSGVSSSGSVAGVGVGGRLIAVGRVEDKLFRPEVVLEPAES
ncbi:MAG TPA: tRNA pseudouridine(55) synthase TruB [Gemmatimonadales bacterium]|nr:tRNA pseudouridine(55) synthase TruB [Gemmatimonadales bacterium]